jgi:hypothetical protein
LIFFFAAFTFPTKTKTNKNKSQQKPTNKKVISQTSKFDNILDLTRERTLRRPLHQPLAELNFILILPSSSESSPFA